MTRMLSGMGRYAQCARGGRSTGPTNRKAVICVIRSIRGIRDIYPENSDHEWHQYAEWHEYHKCCSLAMRCRGFPLFLLVRFVRFVKFVMPVGSAIMNDTNVPDGTNALGSCARDCPEAYTEQHK